MALRAGRVGVRPDQVTPEGIIPHTTPYTLPAATADTLGGVKIGSGVNVAEDGTISTTPYELPTASAETKGGVKIGTGITVDENGVISASGGSDIPIIELTPTTTTATAADILDIYNNKKLAVAQYTSGTYLWYFLINYIEKATAHAYRLYGIGMTTLSQNTYRQFTATITLDDDDENISSVSANASQQDVYQGPEYKTVKYNSTTDTWTNLNNINYRSPYDLMVGKYYFAATEVTDGTTTATYKFIVDYYEGSNNNYTGTVHVGSLVFDYYYSSGAWTLTLHT